MAKHHNWTEEEDKVLVQSVQDRMSCTLIADLLGVNVNQVRARIIRLRKDGIDLPFYHFKWSDKHEKELANLVSKNAGNIREAFRLFAEKYNISLDTVHARYYSKRVKNGRVRDKYPIFGVFGRYRGIANAKMYSRESGKGYNFWSIVKKIFN